jgi:hypothetical protein
MVDHILATYGDDALAAIMDAYRAGATDDEAIAAGTGAEFADIRGDYFAAFGVDEPGPIEPNPLPESDVPLPHQPDGVPGASAPPEPGPEPAEDSLDLVPWLMIGLVVIVVVGAVAWRARRVPPAGGPA